MDQAGQTILRLRRENKELREENDKLRKITMSNEEKDNTIKLKRVKGSVIYDAEKDQIDFEGKKFTGDFLRLISETNTKPIEYKPIRTELSAKETAAIHLRDPESGTKWLDEMIQKARRDEFVKALLIAQGTSPTNNIIEPHEFVEYADALIKATDEGVGEK